MAEFAISAMWQYSDATWWPTLEPMQVAPPDDQILSQSKWCRLVAKFASNASGVMLLPNLIQVTESISESVVPLAMFTITTPTAEINLVC